MGGKRKDRSRRREEQLQPGYGQGFGYPPALAYDRAAYDNTGYYGMDHGYTGVAPRYPEPFGHPGMYDPEYRSRSTDAGISETSSTVSKSSRKKIILVTVIVIVCLVVAAIVAAVTVALLTKDESGKNAPQFEERIIIKTIPGEATLAGKEWEEDYNDPNSVVYNTTATDFIQQMDNQFKNSDKADEYDHTVLTGFRQGSVEVIFTVYFRISITIEVSPVSTPTEDNPVTGDGTTPATQADINVDIDMAVLLQIVQSVPIVDKTKLSAENHCLSNPCQNDGQCDNGIQYTCVCAAGYTGTNCEINIDECASDPCEHGSCTDGVDEYTCNCNAGFTGTNCETNIDDCESDPCINNGTCEDGVYSYQCKCQPGYTGTTCQTDIDECDPNPCIHGDCTDHVNDYTCDCNAGYMGKNCDIDINDCDPDPCDNEATCIDGVNTYTCNCMAGYSGDICDININECDHNPCSHGDCTDAVNDYTCNCEGTGYTGKDCETNINDCETNTCNTGVCTDAVKGYTCNCEDTGFMGDNCQTNINDCETDTCNTGVCTDAVKGYTCNCEDTGFMGDNCETNINDCETDTCNTGVCTDAVKGYTCNCEDTGFIGDNCETNINDCETNTCNTGVCTDAVKGYTCNCEDTGFLGDNCETNINDCETDTCNTGVCTDAVKGYTCNCEDTGFMGDNCQTNINDCETDTCNTGVCTDAVKGYTCNCEDTGFMGDNCQTNINDCETDTCNTGVCTDAVKGYTCNCEDTGFMGDNCQTNIDDCKDVTCNNHGVCKDKVNSYECQCSLGFTGDDCETNMPDCETNACLNDGTCIDEVNTFRCECADGFTGDRCQTDIDDCEDVMCLNGGECIDKVNSYECQCSLGFNGDVCQTNIDDCALVDCGNGVCKDGMNDYSCECTSGWTGEHCTLDIDNCDPDPCINGNCEDGVNSYTCICIPGYEGDLCELDLDECSNGANECATNAECGNIEGYYTCTCLAGYTGDGRTCDDVDECDPGNGCTTNATCTNTEGSYTCTCMPGFVESGQECIDVNECTLGDTCSTNAICENTEGSYTCSCAHGFEGDGLNCIATITSSTTTITTPTHQPTPCELEPWQTIEATFNTSEVWTSALENDSSPEFAKMATLVTDEIGAMDSENLICGVKVVRSFADNEETQALASQKSSAAFIDVLISTPESMTTAYMQNYLYEMSDESPLIDLIYMNSVNQTTPAPGCSNAGRYQVTLLLNYPYGPDDLNDSSSEEFSNLQVFLNLYMYNYAAIITRDVCHIDVLFGSKVSNETTEVKTYVNATVSDSYQLQVIFEELISFPENTLILDATVHEPEITPIPTSVPVMTTGPSPTRDPLCYAPGWQINHSMHLGFSGNWTNDLLNSESTAFIEFNSLIQNFLTSAYQQVCFGYIMNRYPNEVHVNVTVLFYVTSEDLSNALMNASDSNIWLMGYDHMTTTQYPTTQYPTTFGPSNCYNPVYYVGVFALQVPWTNNYYDYSSYEFVMLSQQIQDIVNVAKELNLYLFCGATLDYAFPLPSTDGNLTTMVSVNITVSDLQYNDMLFWLDIITNYNVSTDVIEFEVQDLREVFLSTIRPTSAWSTTRWPTTPWQTTTWSYTTYPTTTPSGCSSSQFQCNDGECIYDSWVCDNYRDCGDNEDEANCDCDPPLIKCPDDRQSCYNPVTELCDGISHCPSGSDEINCPLECYDDFRCTKHQECIPANYTCDGIKDCLDGTDEFVDCPYVPPVSNIPTDIETRLMDNDTVTTDAGYGRVEFRSSLTDDIESEWGTICDDLWTAEIATVICNELNLPTPGYAYKGALYGEGKGPVLLRNIHCDGTENTIQNCLMAQWGSGDKFCTHKQDASLSCGEDRAPPSTTPGTTLTPTTPLPTPDTIRLVGGENCWSGRIEVLHRGIWGTVCDDGFGAADAQVVCRQLGFEAVNNFEDFTVAGAGTGTIWLDELACTGHENNVEQCFHDGWENHDCVHTEDQRITCAGDYRDCPDYDHGHPNVTCNFERNPCGYTTYSQNGTKEWIWTPGDNNFEYTNREGEESDSATLLSPPFNASSGNIRLEFMYKIADSTYGDLTLNRLSETTNLFERTKFWTSWYQSRDIDGLEQYNCVTMPTQTNSSYNIEFVATRGPLYSTMIQIDSVTLGEGTCKTSLLDGICDFNRTSECGLRVVCPGCTRDQKLYTWSLATRPLRSHPYSTQQGNYMCVNSLYGHSGNTAELQFLGLDNSLNKHNSLKFQYFKTGEESTGNLQVELLVDGAVFYTWDSLTSSGNGGDWQDVCLSLYDVNVPADTDVILQFVATKGVSNADICIDNVQLSADGCPIITCDQEQENCGFEIEIPVYNNQSFSSFTWSYTSGGSYGSSTVRLKDGESEASGVLEVLYNGEWRGVCDDGFDTNAAKVVCHQLGYSRVGASYQCCKYDRYNDFWLDDVDCDGTEDSISECYHRDWGNNDCGSREYVAVICTPGIYTSEGDSYAFVIKDQYNSPIGAMVSLGLPTVYLSPGTYHCLLDIIVSQTILLQVTYSKTGQGTMVDEGESHMLGNRYNAIESSETVCLQLDITEGEEGYYTIKVTATKTDYTLTGATAVGNIELYSGTCQESLATHSCTFEDNYKCGYMISTGDTSCEAQYSWQRVKAENKTFTPDKDHTADNKTDGHYMYVSRTHGQSANVATFDPIEISDTLNTGYCALSFYYFLSKHDFDNGGYMQVMTNGDSTNLEGSNDPIWLHGCIDLVDQCPGSIGSLEISFQAFDVNAGLDDIQLLPHSCPTASLNCDFNTADVCGYTGQGWIWDNNDNLAADGKNIQTLYSPLFIIPEESCLEIEFNSTFGYNILVNVINTEGTIVSTLPLQFMDDSGTRTISIPMAASDNQLQMILDVVWGYSYSKFSIDHIELLPGACVGPVLSCLEGQVRCDDNKCIHEYNICDGTMHCQDKTDELNCDCSHFTFNCTDSDQCVHQTLRCDGTTDCIDGSDELCVPNVNCTFDDPYTCGYTMTNAYKASYRDGLVLSNYGLSLVESTVVNVMYASCLRIGIILGNSQYRQLRIVINIDNNYTEMASIDIGEITAYYNEYIYDRFFYVDVPVGEYSVIFESFVYYYSYSYIESILQNVTLIPASCPEPPVTTSGPYTSPTTSDYYRTTQWYENTESTTRPWWIATSPATSTSTTSQYTTNFYTEPETYPTSEPENTETYPTSEPENTETYPTSEPENTETYPTSEPENTETYTISEYTETYKTSEPESTESTVTPGSEPTESLLTTQTPTMPPIPDDFPVLTTSHEISTFIKLICHVENSASYTVIMYWSFQNIPRSRNSDIIFGDTDHTKYAAYFMNGNVQNTSFDYILEVSQWSANDTGLYQCVVDVLPYSSTIWPSAEEEVENDIIEPIEDECFQNTVSFCAKFGFNRVTFPSAMGLDADQAFKYFSRFEGYSGNYYSQFCDETTQELLCGLAMLKCDDNGQSVPQICRETCAGIATSCGNISITGPSEPLDHFCNFLNSSSDGCNTITTTCGQEIFLFDDNYRNKLTSVMFQSQNYPHSPPGDVCEYKVTVEPYYLVKITVINLVDDNEEDCELPNLQITDTFGSSESLCSSNVGNELTFIGNTTLTLSTYGDIVLLGFMVLAERVLPDGFCDIISVPNYSYYYMQRNITGEGCGNVKYYLLYTEEINYGITINITDIEDNKCVSFRNDNDEEQVQVCESGVAVNVSDARGYLSFDVGTQFSIMMSTYELDDVTDTGSDWSVLRVVLSGEVDGAGVVHVYRSDGAFGVLCDNVNEHTADLLCQAAGHGPTASTYDSSSYRYSGSSPYPGLMRDLICPSDTVDINECDIKWNETCPGCSCYYRTYIECFPATDVSCNFERTSCGYEYNSTFIEYGVGFKFSNNDGTNSSLVSPVFTHYTDKTVRFAYGIDGTGSNLDLFIKYGDDKQLLWQRPDYKLEGDYVACVQLPEDKENVDVQLEFSFTAGSGSRNLYLYSVQIQTESCPAAFPDGVCSFRNIDTCVAALADNICPYNKVSVWNLEGNTLIGNSLYAYEDMEYTHDISLSISETNKSLHFSYANTGSDFYELDNDLTFKIYIVSPSQDLTIGDGLQYDEIFSDSENKATSVPTCVTLPAVSSPDTFLSLVLVTGKSLGSIFIDDLQINEEHCPLAGSCNFENFEMCHYQMETNESILSWKLVNAGDFSNALPTDNTINSTGQGHFMVSDQYLSAIGVEHSFSTSKIRLSEATKCLSFYFTHGNISNPDFTHLTLYEVYYDNDEVNKEISSAVGTERHEKWTKVNFQIDIDAGTDVMFTFVAMATDNGGLIAVDDVHILSTDCILGLQDMAVCTFDDPILCNYGTVGTTGAAYTWWKNDGNYMYVDNSYGDEGHTADIFFNVDLTSLTSDQSADFCYQFEFMMTDIGAGSLVTYYEMQDGTKEQEQVITTRAVGDLYDSYCYPLPANFVGRIYIRAVRGKSQTGEIAIDNIKVVEGNQPSLSISCDFETTSSCGYKIRYGNIKDGSLLINSAARLDVPIQVLEADFTEGCISFQFNIDVGQSMKVEVETSHNDVQTYLFTGQSSSDPQYGQISLDENVTRVSYITDYNFNGDFALYDVMFELNKCSSITTCTDGEFTCHEQCVSATSQCDSKDDCNPPVDEENCGYSIPCSFTPTDLCGYRNGTSSVVSWEIQTTYMCNEKSLNSRYETGGFVMTIFKEPTLKPSVLHSASLTIDEISYLTFSYVTTVPHLKVMVTYEETGATIEWVESLVTSTFEWKPAAILVTPGIVTVSFTAYMIDPMHGTANSHPWPCLLVAIDEIQLESIGVTFECPASMPYMCSDYSKCYSDNMVCDGARYCSDGSDEFGCAGDSEISCDFEYGQCNYINGQAQHNWNRRVPYPYQLIPFDHTVGPVSNYSHSGHYMYFTSNPNIGVIYSVNLTSPVETFQDSGCITFWYWLNSTEVQPSALSAQILVYLNYQDQLPVLMWYDKVDRIFEGWIHGGFTVDGARALSVTFVAITWLPFTVYPGTVAIDDIMYSAGTDCQVHAVCNENTFRCSGSGTCIPVSFLCDGTSDCTDHSDEAQCDKPEGAFQLISGDGSYGELRIYQDGMWHKVCYPYGNSDELTEFDVAVAQHVCRELGFMGNYESVNYYYPAKRSDSMLNLECSNGTCTTNSFYCGTGHVAGLRCSHHVCFAHEKLCPGSGTDNQCIKERLFCDGLTDCPQGTDEKSCRCLVDDVDTSVKCRHTPDDCYYNENCADTCKGQNKFECIDHECIPLEKRCNGWKDCDDGSDEQRCVQVEYSDDERVERVTVFDHHLDHLTRSPICQDTVGLSEANLLCRNAGRGYIAFNGIQHGNEQVIGIHVTASHDDTSGTLVPGIDVVEREIECYPLQLYCETPECGTTALFEEQISSYILHGNAASPGEYPWQGALFNYGDMQCGCTWIGGKWILTAGHCTESSVYGYKVRLGITKTYELGPYGQEIQVSRKYDDHYIDFLRGFDFVLLELEYAPILDNYTRPVCLATKESFKYFVDQGSKAECYITGFGATEDRYWQGDVENIPLNEVRVHIVDNETCSRIYQEEHGQAGIVYDGICITSELPMDQACFGDSGGPLVCRNSEGRWEQIGVTSYGAAGICSIEAPAVYSSVPIHLDWVKETTEMSFSESFIYPDDNSNTGEP